MSNSPQFGKPWDRASSHDSYTSANLERERLLGVWASAEEEYKGMQVKVKRLANGKFVVRTRLHPDFEPKKKEKKDGKSSKRNKKNTNGRKFDASATV